MTWRDILSNDRRMGRCSSPNQAADRNYVDDGLLAKADLVADRTRERIGSGSCRCSYMLER